MKQQILRKIESALLPVAFISLTLPVIVASTPPGEKSLDGKRDSHPLTIPEIFSSAEAGDPESQYQLHLIYERGFDTIPADSVKSMEYLRRSAENGLPKSQNLLGYYFIKSGDRKGLDWIEKAAAAGDAKAQANIGFLLLNSDIVERDPSKAAYWLERAASAGVATASSMLGDLYRYGDGVAQDSLQAEAHYYAAIDGGLADAAYKLVDMRGKDWDALPDSVRFAKAIYLYTRQAAGLAIPIFVSIGEHSPDPEFRGKALAMLGNAYTRGLGVQYNHAISTEYFTRAAEEGDPSAAFIIAELLEIFPDALNDYLPKEVPEEMLTSPYWYRKAAEKGVTDAAEATRRLYLAAP